MCKIFPSAQFNVSLAFAIQNLSTLQVALNRTEVDPSFPTPRYRMQTIHSSFSSQDSLASQNIRKAYRLLFFQFLNSHQALKTGILFPGTQL